MIDFTPIFLADASSGLEIEGFWIMFSSNPPFINHNQSLDKLDNTGWDNRNSLLETNTILKDDSLEVSFYPNDIYERDTTAVSISTIKSWYLIYRLPMLGDDLSSYKVALSFSTAELPLSDFWYMQNVIVGKVSQYTNLIPVLIDDTNYVENILRRKYMEGDSSIEDERAELFQSQESDLLESGLYDPTKCVLIY